MYVRMNVRMYSCYTYLQYLAAGSGQVNLRELQLLLIDANTTPYASHRVPRPSSCHALCHAPLQGRGDELKGGGQVLGEECVEGVAEVRGEVGEATQPLEEQVSPGDGVCG